MEPQTKLVTGSICDQGTSKDCKEIKLSFSEVPYPQPSVGISDIEYSSLANAWGVAFSSVLFLYVLSVSIGQILKLVKSA